MGNIYILDNYPAEGAPFPYTFPIRFGLTQPVRTVTRARVVPITKYADENVVTPPVSGAGDFNRDFNNDFYV